MRKSELQWCIGILNDSEKGWEIKNEKKDPPKLPNTTYILSFISF